MWSLLRTPFLGLHFRGTKEGGDSGRAGQQAGPRPVAGRVRLALGQE